MQYDYALVLACWKIVNCKLLSICTVCVLSIVCTYGKMHAAYSILVPLFPLFIIYIYVLTMFCVNGVGFSFSVHELHENYYYFSLFFFYIVYFYLFFICRLHLSSKSLPPPPTSPPFQASSGCAGFTIL